MDRPRLTLFGTFDLRVGPADPRSVPSGKAQALLAYLALAPGAHPRDKLAALLWPDTAPGAARKQLRQTLFVLQKTLSAAAPTALAITSDAIAVVPDVVETDVAAFEAAVAKGTVVALQEAASLYQGELLAGVRAGAAIFEDWLESERKRLRELALQALARLLSHRRADGARGPALAVALRLLALNPVDEATHRAVMRLHLEAGRFDAALQQYDECVTILKRELRVAPETATRELHEEIDRQRAVRTPGTTAAAFDPSQLPLIGRDAEIAQLHRALTEAWSGRNGRVLVVTGEAGVGKTRLLDALAAEAERRGGRVLLGRAYESEQILPLGPFLSALRAGDVLADRQAFSELDTRAQRQLARVFPEFAGSTTPSAATSGDANEVLEALVALLSQLARVQPLALMLDDVHWADDMTARLLGLLRRRRDKGPIIVVVSTRGDEVLEHPALRTVFDELAADPHAVRMALTALGRDDTLTLVERLGQADHRLLAAGPNAQQVWELSGGNPFIVTETLRAIADGVGVDASGTLPLPARVRETIRRRLARLSEPATQLVRVAAVIGREFDAEFLRHATELDQRAATDAFDELIRRRVLYPVGPRFDFVHERVRQAALADVLAPRRQLLHASIAAAMEARRDDDELRHAAALATHYREAAMWDNAVARFREAGRRSIERCAYREAVTFLDHAMIALGCLPESPATLAQALEIRIELRNALFPLGDFQAITQQLQEAMTLAHRLGDRAAELRVASLLLSQFWVTGEPAAGVAEGQRALAIANELDDIAAVVLIRTRIGEASHLLGDYKEAARVFRQNIAALTGDRAFDRFGLLGPPAVHSRVWLVSCLAELGMFAEARLVAADAVAIAEKFGDRVALNFAWAGAGVTALQGGRFTEAIQALERAIEMWSADTPPWLPRYIGALGWARALSGEALRGVELIERALAQTVAFGQLGGRSALLTWLAEAQLLVGGGSEARETVEEAMVLSLRHGERGHRAWALRARAKIRRAGNDLTGAVSDYEAACTLGSELSMRPLVAYCRFGLGKISAELGQWERAAVEFNAARELFASMAMEPVIVS